MVLDSNFNNIAEIPNLNDGCDIFSISYSEDNKVIVCGLEDGTLTTINLAK